MQPSTQCDYRTKCKFCGVLVVACADEQCPKDWANQLAPMLACNRCADYRAGMNRLCDALRGVALNYMQRTLCKNADDKFIAETRATLERITKSLASVICKFYNMQTVWEPDFVEQCFDHPHKTNKVVGAYIRGVRAMKSQAQLTNA